MKLYFSKTCLAHILREFFTCFLDLSECDFFLFLGKADDIFWGPSDKAWIEELDFECAYVIFFFSNESLESLDIIVMITDTRINKYLYFSSDTIGVFITFELIFAERKANILSLSETTDEFNISLEDGPVTRIDIEDDIDQFSWFDTTFSADGTNRRNNIKYGLN